MRDAGLWAGFAFGSAALVLLVTMAPALWGFEYPLLASYERGPEAVPVLQGWESLDCPDAPGHYIVAMSRATYGPADAIRADLFLHNPQEEPHVLQSHEFSTIIYALEGRATFRPVSVGHAVLDFPQGGGPTPLAPREVRIAGEGGGWHPAAVGEHPTRGPYVYSVNSPLACGYQAFWIGSPAD